MQNPASLDGEPAFCLEFDNNTQHSRGTSAVFIPLPEKQKDAPDQRSAPEHTTKFTIRRSESGDCILTRLPDPLQQKPAEGGKGIAWKEMKS